ncbi:MAG: DegT/DnrJ/EryC1/StrS family aminotransferase [Terracidiphilus sp.]
MKVPLLDLKAQYAYLKDEILAAVSEVLDSQVCILGPKVAELEQRVAALSDCKFGVGVSSGTDALLASLMALGIGPGDEVITTPFTFFATAGCISRTGALPVFVDIDPRSYNLDPGKIEAAITPHTKAIIPVHLYGQMCDMDPIMEIAARHNLYVIEDAAQAISATYKGRKAGSVGTVGCFSFFPSKNLGGAGDGGMIVTNDAALHDRLVAMRSHGSKPKYYHKFVGGNFRLDPLQAAILLVKLPHLADWSEARRRNAAIYDKAFANSDVRTPSITPDCVSIFNQYTIRVSSRDSIVRALGQEGIGAEIYYPLPLHQQECFVGKCRIVGELRESEMASRSVLSLPVYPELTQEQLDCVANSVLQLARSVEDSQISQALAALHD